MNVKESESENENENETERFERINAYAFHAICSAKACRKSEKSEKIYVYVKCVNVAKANSFGFNSLVQFCSQWSGTSPFYHGYKTQSNEHIERKPPSKKELYHRRVFCWFSC